MRAASWLIAGLTTAATAAGGGGGGGGGSWWVAECAPDLTGDGVVDIDDLVGVILAWGPCGDGCPADLTEDGTVDVDDMLEVLLGWGPCGCVAAGTLLDAATGLPWDPGDGYVLGSRLDLALELDCLEAQSVVFRTWADGVWALHADEEPPFIYDADALHDGAVPPGPAVIQALLQHGETLIAVLEFPTWISPTPPPLQPACSDGIDNDGDGLVDHPDDPGCDAPSDPDERSHPSGPGDGTGAPPSPGPEPGPAACGNGVCDEGEDAVSCPGDCGEGQGRVLLWVEDFELGDYSRWGWAYEDWSDCATNGFAIDRWVSALHAHRSQISCPASASHRGYGLLRFAGNETVPNFFTPSAGGIDSPHGVVVSFWSWLDAPYEFSVPTGRWVSLMTVTDDCSNAWHGVITLNIDDPSDRLKPVHVDTVTYAPDAVAFPRRAWVRTTVYVNFYEQLMHVWQNGQHVVSATFTRPGLTACQFHFGLYASGANDDIVLYEDNIGIWRLDAPLAGTDVEPWSP